jgi:hypothetical protein
MPKNKKFVGEKVNLSESISRISPNVSIAISITGTDELRAACNEAVAAANTLDSQVQYLNNCVQKINNVKVEIKTL